MIKPLKLTFTDKKLKNYLQVVFKTYIPLMSLSLINLFNNYD